jgi:hypothetical protein
MSATDRSTEEKVESPGDLIRTASGSGKGTSETSDSPEKQDEPDQTVILPKYETSWVHRLLTPPNCRWDPSVPHKLTYSLCILYATVRAFQMCKPNLSSFTELTRITGCQFYGCQSLL